MKRGITLMELMIVVAMLAVLSTLAIPIYTRTVARSRESEGWLFLTAIRSSELRYYNENEEIFTDTPTDLDLDSTVSPLFTYQVTVSGVTFNAIACPRAACGSCRILCLDQDGNRDEGVGCAAICP